MFRRVATALIAVTGVQLLSTLFASAQDAPWPSRTIQLIVPLPAGSAADTVARLIGAKLSERLGQSVVVVNRDGASGAVGTREIAKAAPDGYTLGVATSTTLVTAPILNPGVGYDPRKEFTPISMVGYSPYVLVTHPGVPAKTVEDFVALARSKPGALTYTSVGEASLARLAAELLASMSGIRIVQVPYKSSTQAIIDVLAGRVDSQFGILTTTHQYIREGKLNALGVTTLKRVPEFPEIPTISESGLSGYEASLWLGIIGPARLPEPVAARLNAAINEILAQPATRAALLAQAIVTDAGSPASFACYLLGVFVKWTELAKTARLVDGP